MGQTWGRSSIASTAASPGVGSWGGSAPLPSPPGKQQHKRQRKRLRGGATAGTVPSILLLGASISCHGALGSVRSLMPPQHGLNWRHLKASTESANETGADSSATLPPHPFSTRTLHPSHGHRPSPARTEQGTCPLLPRAPGMLLASLADTLLGCILPKTTRSEPRAASASPAGPHASAPRAARLFKAFPSFLDADLTSFPLQGGLAALPGAPARRAAARCSAPLRGRVPSSKVSAQETKTKVSSGGASQAKRQQMDLQSSTAIPCQGAELRASYQATVLNPQKSIRKIWCV